MISIIKFNKTLCFESINSKIIKGFRNKDFKIIKIIFI